MWIIFVCSQKKFSVELTGEETFHDIETILNEVYGFNPNISFFINSTTISDKSYFTPIQEFPGIQNLAQVVIKEKGKASHICPPNVSQEKAIAIGNDDNNQLIYKSKSINSKRSRNSEKLGSIFEENKKKDHKKSKKKSTDENSVKSSKEDKNTTEKKHKHHKHSEQDGTSRHHKHRDTDGNHKHHKHHKHSDKDGKHKQSDQDGHHKHHRHTKE